MFRSCISKINDTFVENAEDLDIFMLMYNLLEYSDHYSVTLGSLWNYYRDEANKPANEINDADNFRINNNKTTKSKSFEYKTKLVGRAPNNNNNNRLGAQIVVPLEYLSNFWRYLHVSLINCEIEIDLSWRRYCEISEISRTSRTVGNPTTQQMATKTTTSATFQVNNTKLYAPVVTLSNIKFLENIKQGFKRTIYRNKHRSEITT